MGKLEERDSVMTVSQCMTKAWLLVSLSHSIHGGQSETKEAICSLASHPQSLYKNGALHIQSTTSHSGLSMHNTVEPFIMDFPYSGLSTRGAVILSFLYFTHAPVFENTCPPLSQVSGQRCRWVGLHPHHQYHLPRSYQRTHLVAGGREGGRGWERG